MSAESQKIRRADFINALRLVIPAAEKSKVVDQTSHVIFTEGTITTYNERMCISHPIDLNLRCSVDAFDLMKGLKAMVGDIVYVFIEHDTLILEDDQTTLELSTVVGSRAIEDSIAELGLPKIKYEPLPADFLAGVGLCVFSTANDPTKRILMCVAVCGDKVYSSDDLRVSEYTLKGEVPADDFLLPKKSAQELTKLDVIEIGMTPGWAHFRTKDDVTFSTSVISEAFPEVSPFFDVEGLTATLPVDLRDVAKSMSFMTEGKTAADQSVKVTLTSTKVVLTAKKETGKLTRDVPWTYEGPKTSFMINPDFLAEVMLRSKTITLADDRALFASTGFRHVVALMV